MTLLARVQNPKALQQLVAARTALILDQEFWGTLSLRLKIVEDPSMPTAWTDGVHLGYNPDFILGLSMPETIALVAHEVAHCALGHPWRREGREPWQWNVACDRALNPVLRDAKFTLPQGALMELDPSHKGKSAEWIYPRLPKRQGGGKGQGQGGGGGQAGGSPDEKPNPQGEVRDAPRHGEGAEGETDTTEQEWKEAVQQAANVAKMRGKLPASMERFASEAVRSKIDWASVMMRFAHEISRNDYSYRRPNARHMSRGFYLPALYTEELPPMAFGFDTSGSVDGIEMGQMFGQIQAIQQECRPRKIHILYCDAKVQRIDTFEKDEPVVLRPKGGGGTDFRPVFNALEKLDDDPPVALLYLTDGYGEFPREAPEYPVLWVMTTDVEAPFGETVKMS